ncbi:hypothetical protein SpAn4DRAFT_4352 [Sporomusa ovata]|uniref:Uncharacterized protein n=1 Tax=Sporomusa ovata TaxID=2378 RepID=A0A0U1L5L9_9FIRM|nr:hypothetical protein SpAn4DRAFT_4352 [Sporomusa ovata]
MNKPNTRAVTQITGTQSITGFGNVIHIHTFPVGKRSLPLLQSLYTTPFIHLTVNFHFPRLHFMTLSIIILPHPCVLSIKKTLYARIYIYRPILYIYLYILI